MSAIFSASPLAITAELNSSKYGAGCINGDLRGEGFVGGLFTTLINGFVSYGNPYNGISHNR